MVEYSTWELRLRLAEDGPQSLPRHAFQVLRNRNDNKSCAQQQSTVVAVEHVIQTYIHYTRIGPISCACIRSFNLNNLDRLRNPHDTCPHTMRAETAQATDCEPIKTKSAIYSQGLCAYVCTHKRQGRKVKCLLAVD